MRIFYFPSFYPSERPGDRWVGAFTHRQVKALKEAGADVKVVIPLPGWPPWPFFLLFKNWQENRRKSFPSKRVYDDVEIFHPRVPAPKLTRFFGGYREHYKRTVITFLKGYNLDRHDTFLFAQWLPEASLVVEAGEKIGVRTGILGIGDDILKVPLESKEKLEVFSKCWRKASLRGVVADYLGKAANKIVHDDLAYEVFYSSVNETEFYPVSLDEKRLLRERLRIPNDVAVILTVGSAIVRKGWYDLFNALSGLESRNFLLISIYGGPKEIDLRVEAEQLGLAANLLDLGEVPADQIHFYYKIADIFCLPSHWEGLANAVLEAMASGLPVVTTNVCGHPEVITHGINGFLIDVGDIDELRKILTLLLSDSDLRTSVGSCAKSSIRTKPGSHLATARKIMDKFQQLK